MRKQGAERLTLTSKLLVLSIFIVVSTALLVMFALGIGYYDTAKKQVSMRQAPYTSAVVAEISSHLTAVTEVMKSLTEDPALAGSSAESATVVLTSALTDNSEKIKGFVLVSDSGTVIASRHSAFPADLPATLRMSRQEVTYLWQDGQTVADETLWIAMPVGGVSGERYLVAQVRTGFIISSLSHVAGSESGRISILFDGDGAMIRSSNNLLVDTSATFDFIPDEDGGQAGQIRVSGDTAQIGYYQSLLIMEPLGWRVAVVESVDQALTRTWGVLLPGIVGLAVALLSALGVSLAVVSRATRPLRRLERRARALAAGVSVSQESVNEGGEIGGLLEAFNSVVRRLNHMSAVAELMANTPDRWLVLEAVTSSIHSMLASVDVDVMLLTGDRRLELVAAEGALAPHIGMMVALDDVPWITETIETGEPRKANAFAEVQEVLKGLRATEDFSAALSVPLRVGAETFGVLLVVRRNGKAFENVDVETVRSFAAQASVALRKWRLLEDERQSRREAEVLWEVAERVASPDSLGESLTKIACACGDLLGFERAFVVVCEREQYGLEPVTGVSGHEWLEVWKTCTEDVRSGWLYLEDSELATVRPPGSEDARATLIVPLQRGEVFAGLLVMLTAKDRFEPSARLVSLALTVGRQASIALQNAYLYEQAKRRAENLETIFRISQAVSSSLQDRIVLNRVLDVVQKMLPADAVLLFTYDSEVGRMTVPMARGIMDQTILDLSLRPGEDVPGRVFVTREPERYDHLASSDTALLNAASAHGLSSLLAVPLLARGRSIGVLVVFARAEAAFSIEELDLLRTFASQAALAIDTARMFGREHHVATVLQDSILPSRLPQISGIDASSVYLPASSEADIGGDYYDLFTGPDGRVVISIGDVCGKGVVAATKTSMIKYSIRGMIAAGLEPARVLAELNTLIMGTHDPSSIVTLWIGQMDLKTNTLIYANGGHPPGLLLHPEDRRVDRLGPTGALLGAVSEAIWTQREMSLSPGKTLLLYTDGVTEARNGARFFGEGRVLRALRSGGSATAVVQRVLADVRRFSSGDLRDDSAILALVYKPVEMPDGDVTDTAPGGISTGASVRDER